MHDWRSAALGPLARHLLHLLPFYALLRPMRSCTPFPMVHPVYYHLKTQQWESNWSVDTPSHHVPQT